MVNRKKVVKKKGNIFHSIMYIQWCWLHLKVIANYSTSNEDIMGIFLTDV